MVAQPASAMAWVARWSSAGSGGTIRHAGFKFGRWLDLGFWQLVLDTPRTPRDG